MSDNYITVVTTVSTNFSNNFFPAGPGPPSSHHGDIMLLHHDGAIYPLNASRGGEARGERGPRTVHDGSGVAEKSASRARGPQYIAPEQRFDDDHLADRERRRPCSGAPQGPLNLTPGPRTQTAPRARTARPARSDLGPVGTDIFLVNTYSTSNGTGTTARSGSILLSVRQNARTPRTSR